jgi:hypothetical protein
VIQWTTPVSRKKFHLPQRASQGRRSTEGDPLKPFFTILSTATIAEQQYNGNAMQFRRKQRLSKRGTVLRHNTVYLALPYYPFHLPYLKTLTWVSVWVTLLPGQCSNGLDTMAIIMRSAFYNRPDGSDCIIPGSIYIDKILTNYNGLQ